jgi:hypothetical protein
VGLCRPLFPLSLKDCRKGGVGEGWDASDLDEGEPLEISLRSLLCAASVLIASAWWPEAGSRQCRGLGGEFHGERLTLYWGHTLLRCVGLALADARTSTQTRTFRPRGNPHCTVSGYAQPRESVRCCPSLACAVLFLSQSLLENTPRALPFASRTATIGRDARVCQKDHSAAPRWYSPHRGSDKSTAQRDYIFPRSATAQRQRRERARGRAMEKTTLSHVGIASLVFAERRRCSRRI